MPHPTQPSSSVPDFSRPDRPRSLGHNGRITIRKHGPRRLGALLTALTVMGACGGEPDEAATNQPPPEPVPVDPSGWTVRLTEQSSASEALFIAISPINADTAWISGTGGTWARTEDGGSTWTAGTVAGHEGLQFRDVAAFDSRTAVLMAAGDGPDSRLFRTEDGGETWTETFVMPEPAGFLDCMAFWDDQRGLVYGDEIDGGIYVLETADGGRSWNRVPPGAFPAAQQGEGGFASSGTCVDVRGSSQAWIGTGNATEPRVLVTEDGGATWQAFPIPLRGGSGSGVTSIGVRPDGAGYAVGGSLDPDVPGERTAVSNDGGRTWTAGGPLAMPGAPYGGTWLPGLETRIVFAAGPTGLDWSRDGGMTWESLSANNYWAVEMSSDRTGWATGPGGRITRLDLVR